MSQNGSSIRVQPSGGKSVGSATIRFTTTLSELITAHVVIIFPYATATQRQSEVARLYTKPTSKRAVPVVVVGNAMVDASNNAPHVIAIEVVPVIEIHSFCPLTGVPVRLVVNDVIATVCPVITSIS
jgi:hypothetical protein